MWAARGEVSYQRPERAFRKSRTRYVAAAAWQLPCAQDGLITIVNDTRAGRQQFVKLRGVVARTIGSDDEDLPTLFCKGPRLGDSDERSTGPSS